MNAALTGGALGLAAGSGAVVAVTSLPPMRPVRLIDRVAPYLGGLPSGQGVRATGASEGARQLLGPVIRDAVGVVDRVVGGSASVRRRLGGLGVDADVESFRIEQVVWAAVAMTVSAVLLTTAGWARGAVDPVVVAVGALSAGVGGVLARDRQLTWHLARRNRMLLAELPVIADLLALSMVAGEGPDAALARVAAVSRGALSRDLDAVLRRCRSGASLTTALQTLARATTCIPMSRFLDAVTVGIERGTPLADVLRAQALDAREASHRALLATAGKKEIVMLLPVVFLILPVTVLFALYPGLLTLTSIA